ncbi:MAG: PEGA domain-containing protein [Rhodopirellula sp.]|nr:PEGA domain-containing protein [Rhodopirellula sp.]
MVRHGLHRYTPALVICPRHPRAVNLVTRGQLKTAPKRFHRWWKCIPLLLVVLTCFTGCVRRRMTIRTNPPGALVYVDDYEIGTTPVSTNFTYYGTRKIRLVKEGYETLTVMQPIPAPWYQFPPFDFVSENLVPGEIRDRRDFTFQLRPQVVVPVDQLRGRAEELRAQGQLPLAMAPPTMTPPAFSGAPPVAAPSSGSPPGSFESIPTPPAGPMTPAQPAQPAQPTQPYPPAWPPPGSTTQPPATGLPPGTAPSQPFQAPPGAWQPPPAPAVPQNYPG